MCSSASQDKIAAGCQGSGGNATRTAEIGRAHFRHQLFLRVGVAGKGDQVGDARAGQATPVPCAMDKFVIGAGEIACRRREQQTGGKIHQV